MIKCKLDKFRLMRLIILAVTLYSLPYAFNYAEPIPSANLINNAKDYDAKEVSFVGEVIGEIMSRGEYVWINVNDGKNAIGIWIKKELIKGISYTGSYKAKGDLVEITGRFNRACREHGGDLDIHAQSINKISSGNKTHHVLATKAIRFALVLTCLIGLVLLLKVCQPKRSVLI
jgi:hypothetical protein